jgi:hypothetical protein
VGVLARLIVEIALLRRPPQALPASTVLTALALVAYGATGALLAGLLFGAPRALPYALADAAILAGAVALLLRVAGHPERMRQTLSALGGTGALLNLASLPLLIGTRAQAPDGPAALAVLAVFAWSFVITAHVLRHALSAPLPAGVLAAFGYFALSYAALGALFPLGT